MSRRFGSVAVVALWCVAAASAAAPAAESKVSEPDDLLLITNGRQAMAQFDTECLPDADSQLTDCVDSEPRPLRASLRMLRTARRVDAQLALPALRLTVVLERTRGRDLTLSARPTSAARDAFTFTVPKRARSGDTLRVTARYEPRGNATFLTRLRFARCRD